MEKIILECQEGNLLGDSNFAHNYRIFLDGNLYIISLFNPSIFKTHKFEAEKEFIQKKSESIYLLKPIRIFQNEEFTCFLFNNSREWTLHSYVCKKGILSEAEALHYLKQIYYGYNCYVNAGLSKRDLTLENVILTNTTENNDKFNTNIASDIASYHNIRIFDFGFKMHQKDNDNLYQAPECFDQDGYIAGISDVWSLGMIFYYMLFGKLPFKTKKAETFLRFIKLFEIQIPNKLNNLSNSTEDLLKRMLKSDPMKRISWKDLIHELEREEVNEKSVQKFNKKKLLSFYDEDENKKQQLILFSDSENEEPTNPDINSNTKMAALLEKIKNKPKKTETNTNKMEAIRNSLKLSVMLFKESFIQVKNNENIDKTPKKVLTQLPTSPLPKNVNEEFKFVSIYEGNRKKFISSVSLKISLFEEYSSQISHRLSLFAIFERTNETGSIELGGRLDLWGLISFLITKKLICLRIQFKNDHSCYTQFKKEFLESEVYIQLMYGFDAKTNELKKKMKMLMEIACNLLKRFDKEEVNHIIPFMNLDYEQDFEKIFHCFLRLYEKLIDGMVRNRKEGMKDAFFLTLSKHKVQIYECLVIAEAGNIDLVESNMIAASGDEERIREYGESLREQLMYFSIKHGFTNF